ncbi:MAG TPA: tetratricopeptide repeat protein, partial [Elusimicrobiales bacterium]|nr:tetratricopeptide repeat protein [Elusimicrobiales bacterium]
GALGVVSTIEGDAYKLAGLTPEDNIPAWAAGEIARHPFRYAASVLRRLGTVLSRHLLLLAAALAGFWLFRADRGFRALGVLALYFLLIHCSMSVEERYFVPFWALLIPAAAAPLGPLTEKLRAFSGKNRSAALHAAPFLPLAVLSLFVLGLVFLYPARARSHPFGTETITALLAENPLHPWLYDKLGRLYLKEGRSSDAAEAFRRAYGLSGNAEYLSGRALALMSAGSYEEMNSLFSAHDAGYTGMLVRMLYELKTGKNRAAAETFRLAGERHLKETCFLRNMQGPYEAGIYSKLLGSDTRLGDIHLTALLRLLPFEERLGLLEGLSGIGLDGPSFEVMLELQNLGRYAEAKKIAGRLLAGSPDDPDYLNAAGVLESLSGDLKAGAELLRRAIRASPDYIPAYLSLAAVYHRSGRVEDSARVYTAAAERCRDDSEVCRAARELAAGVHSR